MANPFNDLYELMGSATVIEPSFFIAVISSPMPNLKVKMEGIELDKTDFLVSKNLILSNNANITCTNGTIEHNLKDTLKIGDKVLLVKVGDKFIITGEVVAI